MTTHSPLKAIEDFSYQKVKNTPFRVWHYAFALFVLMIVPIFVPSAVFSSLSLLFVYEVIMSGIWLISRNIGTNLSRNKAVDSVLIYRFFATAPWLVSTVSAGIILLTKHLDDVSRLLYAVTFWASAVVLVASVLGIIIHLFKRKKMVKNIKKDELFQ